MKKVVFLLLVMLGGLGAQSTYCSDHCEGTPDSRNPPMEFHFSFVRSVKYYLQDPQERDYKLKKCQEAFDSTLKINYITKSFKKDCKHAQMALEQAQKEEP
ncbi:hypothetical protein [Helicobacter acinonychis]|uniref:Uncharacterized protein n=1 Tax=Helicobacter acinonychis (strain Sheeba) TaxID=382638 RepID=Q17YQ1_HELAH|nr:hypothetical protein [Helicobacter acinonychis]CAJ99225.1 conserved hypothetical protein [Helicobacter acinonychis str. Sheeba]STP04657.1 Uncharacterised protein [Helicobacter acinonychis]